MKKTCRNISFGYKFVTADTPATLSGRNLKKCAGDFEDAEDFADVEGSQDFEDSADTFKSRNVAKVENFNITL